MRIDVSTRWYEVVFATAGVLPDHAAPPQDIDVKGYDWSNATMQRLGEGTLAPEKAPVYLLRHYLAHFLAAEAPVDDLMAVTQAKWMRARQALDGSDYGIAYDLTRIRDDLLRRHAAGGPPCFDERYRTALFLSSIRSVSSNVPAELLRAALDAKVITLRQVLHLARSGSNDEYRAEKLTLVVPHLPEDERSQVVGEALTAALRIEDDKARAEAVRRLAPHLLPKQQGEALTAAQAITVESWRRASIVTELPPPLPVQQREAEIAEFLAAAENKHRRFVLIYTETLIAMELVSPSAMASAIIDAQAMWP